MRIIRDSGNGNGVSFEQMALQVSWGVTRCNVKGCRNQPNTIIVDDRVYGGVYGLCEEHFQQGNVPGGCKLSLYMGTFEEECDDV